MEHLYTFKFLQDEERSDLYMLSYKECKIYEDKFTYSSRP
jgi:hypothetical protein